MLSGLYATKKRWRIDPWLYGNIRNLHLRFQQLHLLCRQPRHIHDRRFIHTLCRSYSLNMALPFEVSKYFCFGCLGCSGNFIDTSPSSNAGVR